jgi:UDP-N-acetylmuramyl pentapeptide phosphotransferase/UDP-N-acetylglucosamine-1-phosphate transferase
MLSFLLNPTNPVGVAVLGLFALVSSYGLGWLAFKMLLRCGIVDQPNRRSSHSIPTVRGGGVAIMAAILGGALLIGCFTGSLEMLTLTGIALALAVVSFADDLMGLKARWRFLAQSLAGAGSLLIISNRNIAGWLRESSLPLLLGTTLVALIWVVGYTNAFNFMDGINGLAATQATITSLGTILLILHSPTRVPAPPVFLAALVAGAALGFLPHNFPSARMFMGDVSSAPLGFLLATITLWCGSTVGGWMFFALCLLHANFVLDTGVTLFRRIIRGERWYDAHREHFYQRLIRAGKPHIFVTSCEAVLQIVVVLLLVFSSRAAPAWRWVGAFGVIFLWGSFFVYAEARFRCFSRSVAQRPVLCENRST